MILILLGMVLLCYFDAMLCYNFEIKMIRYDMRTMIRYDML